MVYTNLAYVYFLFSSSYLLFLFSEKLEPRITIIIIIPCFNNYCFQFVSLVCLLIGILHFAIIIVIYHNVKIKRSGVFT